MYKGKYLVCFYAKDGTLIDVFESASEIQDFLNLSGAHYTKSAVYSMLNHVYKTKSQSSKIKFVDVFEIHNDVFAEEDKLFLDFLIKYGTKTKKQQATEVGCSYRTLLRKQKVLER